VVSGFVTTPLWRAPRSVPPSAPPATSRCQSRHGERSSAVRCVDLGSNIVAKRAHPAAAAPCATRAAPHPATRAAPLAPLTQP
jgi:hypothetical protein